MEEIEEKYRQFIKEKKIPILILDDKWHQLFQFEKKTLQIKRLEQELGRLLQKQGKLGTEIKAVKKVKAELAKDIVDNMEAAETEDKKIIKHQEKNQKMLQNLSDKTVAYEEELEALPTKIENVNRQLMLESMSICYQKMKNNEQKIQETGIWIERMREELKAKVLEKQSLETQNEQMYSYMHDVLGPSVVDVLDVQYRGNES